jgi:predicted amidohydrolase
MSYVIGVNRTGKDSNNYTYSGNSIIVDYLGEELSFLRNNEVGIVSAVIEKVTQKTVRKKFGFLSDKDSFSIGN